MTSIYLYLRSPSVSIPQAPPCVCLLHGLLGWPVSDVCLCSRTLSLLLAIRLSCLIAMATDTLGVTGNCNVVSLPCFTGLRNWSFCELRVFDNVRRIKAIRWLILLPHKGTLDPLMTNYAASVAYTASVSQVLQDVKELSQSGTCQLLLNWFLFMNKLLS